jgi:hypothetical protein
MSAMDSSDNDQQQHREPVRGLDKFGDDAHWFRDLLASKCVNVVSGSEMDIALKAMTRASEAVLHPPSGPDVEAKAAQLLQTDDGRFTLERFLLDAVAGANLCAHGS